MLFESFVDAYDQDLNFNVCLRQLGSMFLCPENKQPVVASPSVYKMAANLKSTHPTTGNELAFPMRQRFGHPQSQFAGPDTVARLLDMDFDTRNKNRIRAALGFHWRQYSGFTRLILLYTKLTRMNYTPSFEECLDLGGFIMIFLLVLSG